MSDLHHMPFSLKGGWIALMFASMCGKVECVRILLEMGAQANTQNEVSSSSPV